MNRAFLSVRHIVLPALLLACALAVAVALPRSPQAQAQTGPYSCWTTSQYSPTGASNSTLYAVAGMAENDLWGVGEWIYDDEHAIRNLIMHWDGTNWSYVPSPSVDYSFNLLTGVDAVASNDVWAIGSNRDPLLTVTLPIALHWDGALWNSNPLPRTGEDSDSLYGVAHTSANDVWAVGDTVPATPTCTTRPLIFHWDGSAWSRTVIPAGVGGPCWDGVLNAVAAVSPNNIWAVGKESSKPVVMHWDGRSWSAGSLPGSGEGELKAITALNDHDIWAVGNSTDAGALALHWDGTKWSLVPVYGQPAVSKEFIDLATVSALGPNDVWAAGEYQTSTGSSPFFAQGDVEQLAGTAVAQLSSLQRPQVFGSAKVGTALWLVGRNTQGSGSEALAVRYTSAPCNSLTPTVTAGTSPLKPPVPLPGGGSFTFPQTGKTVSGVFLQYWQQHGGLAQQGYPISNLIGEVSPLDGKLYTVQYFERAVFEYHPEKKPPYNVLLSQLGTYRYRQKYPNGAPNQRQNHGSGTIYFPQTDKHLGGLFRSYWLKHGGLMQQGYPLSEEFTEVSPLDGKPYTVQYFERAVFEYHPEFQGTGNEVLLSLLGTFRWQENYAQSAP